MKVLVTGGAGFIGSNLCRRLLTEAAVDVVTVIDDLSTGYASNINGLPVRFVRGSILDEDALSEAVRGADAIVHLAALGSVPRSVADPVSSHEANASGTLAVLQAARRVGGAHVIMSSSSSVYGANPVIPKSEELMCQPMSPYAVSKLAAEQYLMAFAQCYELPVLPFRFFNVYGPRQMAGHAYAAVIPVFVEAALRGSPLPINGDGSHSRDFTFVGTVTDILTRAVLTRATGDPTNLAFGSRTTLLELIGVIERAVGRKAVIEFRPERSGDVRHSQADNERLRSLFGDLQPVPLEAGVAETVDWMRGVIS